MEIVEISEFSSDVHSSCVLCDARGHHHRNEFGRLCSGCYSWLMKSIIDVGVLVSQAASCLSEASSRSFGSSSAFGSRPPLNVSAVDPELELMELNLGDASSSVTILEMLEMWERSIREDRGLIAYGLATSMRQPVSTSAALAGCVGFLSSNVAWISETDTFDVVEFADHLRRALAKLRRWDLDRPGAETRIICPGYVGDQICGALLRISSADEPIFCRRCGRSWSIAWLIHVAGEDADGWADVEAAARLSGLHERTIRKWATRGKVRKRGLLYNLRDLSEQTKQAVFRPPDEA